MRRSEGHWREGVRGMGGNQNEGGGVEGLVASEEVVRREEPEGVRGQLN